MREETKEQSIRVVLVEPGKYAREAVIGTELSIFRRYVEVGFRPIILLRKWFVSFAMMKEN